MLHEWFRQHPVALLLQVTAAALGQRAAACLPAHLPRALAAFVSVTNVSLISRFSTDAALGRHSYR